MDHHDEPPADMSGQGGMTEPERTTTRPLDGPLADDPMGDDAMTGDAPAADPIETNTATTAADMGAERDR